MKDKYCVVTFFITQHALAFEKKMLDNNKEVKLMPVPRQVSSSCGTAARVSCEEKDEILEFCKVNNMEIEGFFEIEPEKKKSFFKK